MLAGPVGYARISRNNKFQRPPLFIVENQYGHGRTSRTYGAGHVFGRREADANLGSMGEGERSDCGINSGRYPAYLEGVLKNNGPDSSRGIKSGHENEVEEKAPWT